MNEPEELQQEIDMLEKKMLTPDFWKDSSVAQEVIKRVQELKILLAGGSKYDTGPALVNIFAGAGGDDAEDFVKILFQMYSRYALSKGYELIILDESPNNLAGYRNISFEIQGFGAYGKLAAESGVHRLVRKSPFNAKNKRQTGFALVEVLPKLERKDYEFDDSRLTVTFAKSQGAGGQNVNKRETAVRVVDPVTGFSVFVSKERTQERNRELALSMMRAKLYKKHLDDQQKLARGLSISDKVSIEWGSQMRSYVFDPYQMIKDHQSGAETRKIEAVLSGDLSAFGC